MTGAPPRVRMVEKQLRRRTAAMVSLQRISADEAIERSPVSTRDVVGAWIIVVTLALATLVGFVLDKAAVAP